MEKTVYNTGYIGEGIYKPSLNGKNTKVYQVWVDMLERCYHTPCQLRQPTYIGCTVVEEWHNFQNFAQWFTDNYIEKYQLDKDLLFSGNKVYSPLTCCFIPQEINLVIVKKLVKDLPAGITLHQNKYRARVREFSKEVYLGSFNTIEEAFKAYKKAKETHLKVLANKYKLTITEPCYVALCNYKIN